MDTDLISKTFCHSVILSEPASIAEIPVTESFSILSYPLIFPLPELEHGADSVLPFSPASTLKKPERKGERKRLWFGSVSCFRSLEIRA
jgi:hypothetical protein